MPEDYLTIDQALEALQMSQSDLHALVTQNRIHTIRDHNTLLFSRADIERLRGERSTEPTTILGPGTTPPPAGQPVAEEPIDLLSSDILDYDDTADTIIGGDLDEGEPGLGLADLDEPAAAATPPPGGGTQIPTIELTPSEPSADDTAVPTLELSESADTGAETDVPTMVLGLDEYDDTQLPTEEVATEEVYIDEKDLGTEEVYIQDKEAGAQAAYGVAEQPYGLDEQQVPGEAVEPITGRRSSGGTSAGVRYREQPSALYTSMCAIAAIMLLIPGGIFFFCMVSRDVPKLNILHDIIKFVWEQAGLTPP